MTRLYTAGMALLLLAEACAGLGFCLGFFWLGGIVPGLVIALACLVLLLLPWLGDLVLEFDSLPKEVKLRLAWWGRAQVLLGDEKMLRARLLGLPYRRSLRPREAKPGKPRAPKPDLTRWARENARNLSRLALAGLQAGNELFRESKTFSLTVNAPAQADVVDQIIAGLIGRRRAHVFELRVLPEGPRRVRAVYRIGLLQVAAIGLFVLTQGQALALARSLGRAAKQAKAAPRSRPSP